MGDFDRVGDNLFLNYSSIVKWVVDRNLQLQYCMCGGWIPGCKTAGTLEPRGVLHQSDTIESLQA